MESKNRYPNISMIIGVVLSLMYALLIISILMGGHMMAYVFLTVGLLSAYWYAMYTAKKKFITESFTVAQVRLVNVGGLFLFFFSSFYSCVFRIF